MKTRLINKWESIRTSLWFLPTIMVIVSAGFALAISRIDVQIPSRLKLFFYAGGPEGARVLLSTIAGSVITVAGVTFSVTIVALTLTTSQFGPRLLRNFMVDRVNQIVLGAFIATFIYCLLVLKSIQTNSYSNFIPEIAVSFSFIFVLADLGLLIYFFHHISTSIHAEQVINAVYHELEHTIDRLFKAEDEYPISPEIEHQIPDFQDNSFAVISQNSGYLRAIDVEGVLKLAEQDNLIIQIKYRPGDYVFSGSVLARVIPNKEEKSAVEKKLISFLILGSKRSPEQDIEFAIHQLVEVALRALSPGINDPYTAISCINLLGSILCEMNSRKFPGPYRYDKEGHLRLVMDVFTYDGILDAAFNQIRQTAGALVAVHARLLETLYIIAETAQDKNQRLSVKRHAEMIHRSARSVIEEKNDLADIDSRYEKILKVIEE
ncbi:MAG: DUF2254 domain-containing protein [Calditrichaeota bacterium]|nr:DUF2254 domain-containing protein [Calditrichota bacterium]